MKYTEKQIENAKKAYSSMLQYRTVESYQPEFIGQNNVVNTIIISLENF
jgi:hypothetical protein